jgi:CheY-like chemotaxis protein
LAAELIPHLFVPFMQADTTLDRTKGGLGLGLALVKGLVELHGGQVLAESPGVGMGASFSVTLPALRRDDDEQTRGTTTTGAAAQPCARRRVLLIEDNLDAAETLKEALELENHVVEVAHTGEEGLDMAHTFHPDVVLCDIGLPDHDGYWVARSLRADPSLQAVTLVALSGYASSEDVARGRLAGFDKHLAKPADIASLDRALTEEPQRRASGA